jgi:hypothetical protein
MEFKEMFPQRTRWFCAASVGLASLLAAFAPPRPLKAASADTYLPWEGGAAYYQKWSNGPSADSGYFPIAVWLQSPDNAAEYKSIGVNLFVGLWRGPTEAQLKTLAAAGMPVLAGRTRNAASTPGVEIIRGWSLMDEPDNAQDKPGGGYGPCILPPAIVDQYRALTAADPTRPVFLNLGQGVINEKWNGRGEVCGKHDEHYAQYIGGADIVSYDVYPVNSKLPLWYVGAGVERLRKWANYGKPIWNWIETTAIRQGPKPTPAEIKAEVWMSIVHGTRGIGYFCHSFSPVEVEAGPLRDPETRRGLAAINQQVASLAHVLNERSVANGVTVSSANAESPVDTLLKRYGGATYLFAVGSRPGGETTASFTLRDCGNLSVEVLGESRTIPARGGVFRDSFANYHVHLYKIPFDPSTAR